MSFFFKMFRDMEDKVSILKKSILFVIGNLDMGGAEKSLVRLCQALNPNKYEISVLVTLYNGKCILREELPSNIKLIHVNRRETNEFKNKYPSFLNNLRDFIGIKLWGDKRIKNKMIRRFLNMLGSIEMNCYLKYVRNLFRNQVYDVSVGFIEEEPNVIATHCITSKKKYIFYRHGSVKKYQKDDAAFEKCDYLIAVSNKLKESIIKEKKYCAEKILVLHNIYDFENIIRKSNQKIVYDNSKIVLVTVGRFHVDKGQSMAIKAAKGLNEKGINYIWYFVGECNSEYGNYCKTLVKEFELQDRVIFVGMLMNPYPYMRIADVYIQPSKYEALGNTIVEAMCLKRPIVSTSTYGANELIKDKVNGLLCEYDSAQLTNSIMRLLTDEYLRSKIQQGLTCSLLEFEKEIERYDVLFSENGDFCYENQRSIE